MKKLILILLGISLLLPGCAYAVRYDGEYGGKVIDANTGEPLEGVVVLGAWYTEYYGAGGAVHKFYDAKETVTDKNGDFSISGQGIEVMSNVTPMDFFIYKAGYNYIGGTLESFRKSFFYRDKIKWEGNKPIVPLKKLTMEERKKEGPPSRPSMVPDEKMRKLTEEINKERISIGVTPFK